MKLLALILFALSTTAQADIFNGHFQTGPFSATTGWTIVRTSHAGASIKLINRTAPACTRCPSDRALRLTVTSMPDIYSLAGPTLYAAPERDYRQKAVPGVLYAYRLDFRCNVPYQIVARYWLRNGQNLRVPLGYSTYNTAGAWVRSPIVYHVPPAGAFRMSVAPMAIGLGATGTCDIDNLTNNPVY